MLYGKQRTHRLPFLGCLLGAVCILMSAAAPADVASVRNLLKDGKLQDALSAVNGDLKQSPDNVTLRFLKGVILTRLNRLDDAETIFKELINAHPELPEPYNNLAVIYAAEGKYEDARELLQKAIDTHPSYATADENLGDIYAKMASRAYNHALQLDEHNKSARAKLALINNLFSLSNPPGAAQAAKAAPSPVAAKTETAPPEAVEHVPAQSAAAKSQKAAAAEAAPAPAATKTVSAAPVEAKASNADAVTAVRRTIDLWVTAWSDKDVSAYLSHYAPDFKPDGGMSRRRWRRERKQRIGKPAFIKIKISNVRVHLKGSDHATARFTQNYQSDTYSDHVVKTLTFKKVDAKWLITSETTS